MKMRGTLAAVVKLAGVAMLASSFLLLGVLQPSGNRRTAPAIGISAAGHVAAINLPRAKDDPKWKDTYGKLPLSFEENSGQTAREVRYVSHGTGYALFLTSQEAVISLQQSMPRDLSPLHRMAYFRALHKARKAGRTTVLRMRMEGANPTPQIAGVDSLPGKVNYILGNNPEGWRTGIPTYAKVKYEGIYPGVDLVFYGNQRRLEYDFVVAAGTDPKVIELSLNGGRKLIVDTNGNLILRVAGGQGNSSRSSTRMWGTADMRFRADMYCRGSPGHLCSQSMIEAHRSLSTRC
jgi:hypothetical protein